MLWLPVPLAARWGGLLAATAYALFSGWGVPSQRTVWMLVTVTVLQSLGLHWPWALVLLSAAVVAKYLEELGFKVKKSGLEKAGVTRRQLAVWLDRDLEIP